jgi:hypothetical protein
MIEVDAQEEYLSNLTCFICKKELTEIHSIRCHRKCIRLVSKIQEFESIVESLNQELSQIINN